jgi:hypothetical protein
MLAENQKGSMALLEPGLSFLKGHLDLVADALNGTNDADGDKSCNQGILDGGGSSLAGCKSNQRLHSWISA